MSQGETGLRTWGAGVAEELELGRDWELVVALPTCVQPREAETRAPPRRVTGGRTGCKASSANVSL